MRSVANWRAQCEQSICYSGPHNQDCKPPAETHRCLWQPHFSLFLFNSRRKIYFQQDKFYPGEFYKALHQSFSLWVKFPCLSSPLILFFSIYSFIHTYIKHVEGGLLCGRSTHWGVSLASIPLDPSRPPSHPTQQWKGTGREGEDIVEGGLSGLGFMSALIVFFLLLSNSTLNQLQGENQGSETLTNLPKVTQLESSRLRLEAGYDNLQGLCPPPQPCHPPLLPLWTSSCCR